MAPLHEIKSTPGKGRGLYATQDIKPGTIVMDDRRVMVIDKNKGDANSCSKAIASRQVTEGEVQAAYNKLTSQQQAEFIQLHEGNRPLGSKLMRVFVTNSMREVAVHYMLLKISMLNHSCVPNVESEPDIRDRGRHILYAVKPIAKGEEIVYSYYGTQWTLPKRLRVIVLQAYYGFECTCPACTLAPAATALSDARRLLMRAMWCRLNGHETPYMTKLAKLTAANADSEEMRNVGTFAPLLIQPLTLQQKTAYHFLLAKLAEAEDCVGFKQAGDYLKAAYDLFEQMEGMMEEYRGLVVPAAYRIYTEWQNEAARIGKRARGDQGLWVAYVRMEWDSRKNKEFVKVTDRMKATGALDSKAFALRYVADSSGSSRRLLALNERVCKQVMSGQTRRDAGMDYENFKMFAT
ncbi:hypothetical protein LTR17_015464 [Elasticomyces elasticus]|nr:hypothetical protein LTR17_015464 [Elasticomyces elasticus]